LATYWSNPNGAQYGYSRVSFQGGTNMHKTRSFTAIVFLSLILAFAGASRAAITVSGNLLPWSHSWWTAGGDPEDCTTIGGYLHHPHEVNPGKVIVDDGSRLACRCADIGYERNYGYVTVTGPGSTWDVYGKLKVAQGRLDITDGGTVNSGEASVTYRGLASVTGNGSSWNVEGRLLVLPYYITTSLTVADGAKIAISSYLETWGGIDIRSSEIQIGGQLIVYGSSGRLEVTHGTMVNNGDAQLIWDGSVSVDDSVWTVEGKLSLTAGSEWGTTRTTTMHIVNGGVVNTREACLGTAVEVNHHAPPRATIEGPGSRWEIAGPLTVGQEAPARLEIINGGVVNSGYGCVGCSRDGAGYVVIDGEGSAWNIRGGLRLGTKADATIMVKNHGTLSAQSLEVGKDAHLYVSRTSTLRVNGALRFEPGSRVEIHKGAEVHLGSLVNHIAEGDRASGLSSSLRNMRAIFDSGRRKATLEVASKDLGPVIDGLDDFGLGTLQIGGDDVGSVVLWTRSTTSRTGWARRPFTQRTSLLVPVPYWTLTACTSIT